MSIEFFLPMEKVPTYTAQQRKASFNKKAGRIMFYKDKRGKAVTELYTWLLKQYRPAEPIEGAIQLETKWCFGIKDKRKHGYWKTTTPDTDNLTKLFKDVMSDVGFWYDDKQVVVEKISKLYTSYPGIYVSIKKLEEIAADDEVLAKHHIDMSRR